ncbi:Sapep family Mn(2+)-dependent dipeptidase [Paenibacillus qinlingensis]|uniref:Succinyl-diaminopimelate desuccinylase n=1 Tax=Paenibacillus qinlingensis TaxID=1837343 RepID=A0ABU1P4Z4_9BACL|nr:Sapep family Mn(2+)-dependent dipeptidase [Paenibacillus qinlingensis]MDR6554823.1 succinyl-diaminopimelate desuccinylase [Paenibacillus qinlingensis]
MIIGKEIHKYRDAIIAGISELVQIKSIKATPEPGKPFGAGVDRALQYMLQLAESLGFEVTNVDGYAGHAEYGQGEEIAAVLVHLDTVEEGEGWTFPPFGGLIENGKIIGRGASDNKGPSVVALYALKTLMDLGITGSRRLRLIFGTNEESGMRDLEYYFEREQLPVMAFAPDAGYPIFNVEMGSMNVVFSSEQESASTKPQLTILSLKGGNMLTLIPETCTALLSLAQLTDNQVADFHDAVNLQTNMSFVYDDEGRLVLTAGSEFLADCLTGSRNAIVNMVAFLRGQGLTTNWDPFLHFLNEKIGAEKSGQSLGIACSDSESGALILFLRTISCDLHRAESLSNIRYPVSHDGAGILSTVAGLAGTSGIHTELTRHLLPVYVPENHPVIVRLSRAYKKMTGDEAVLLRMGAGTYARKLRNNGVAFGAGLPGGVDTHVHQADEFVFIDDMMQHAEICLQGMYELWID